MGDVLLTSVMILGRAGKWLALGKKYPQSLGRRDAILSSKEFFVLMLVRISFVRCLDAQIHSFTPSGIVRTAYAETEHYKITKNSLNRTEVMLREPIGE